MAFTAPPLRHDVGLVIGDTWQPATIEITDDDGEVYDLTGASGECQIRTESQGELLLTATVSIDAGAGTVTWAGAAADTADLTPQSARYSVRLTFADATVRTLVEGVVTIRRGIVG